LPGFGLAAAWQRDGVLRRRGLCRDRAPIREIVSGTFTRGTSRCCLIGRSGNVMLKPFAAVLCLFMASPSLAAEWRYEGGGVPIAYVDTGAAQFQFACRGGDLAMGFWVRKPSKTVAEASSM